MCRRGAVFARACETAMPKLSGEHVCMCNLCVCNLCANTGGRKQAARKGTDTALPRGEDKGLGGGSPALPLTHWLIAAK